jgi:hypothetical protein
MLVGNQSCTVPQRTLENKNVLNGRIDRTTEV